MQRACARAGRAAICENTPCPMTLCFAVDTEVTSTNIHTEGRPTAGTVHLIQGVPSRANEGVYANSPCGEIRIPTELKTLSQRNISVEKRAERIQLDLDQNAKDLGARDPRNTAHAEMKSYGIEGRYIALVVGRFGELQGLSQGARLHCPSESLRVQ